MNQLFTQYDGLISTASRISPKDSYEQAITPRSKTSNAIKTFNSFHERDLSTRQLVALFRFSIFTKRNMFNVLQHPVVFFGFSGSALSRMHAYVATAN